jgi:hypothetical protein
LKLVTCGAPLVDVVALAMALVMKVELEKPIALSS